MGDTDRGHAVRRPFMAEMQQLKRPRPGAPETDAAPIPIPSPRADNTEVLRAIADLGSRFDRFLSIDRTEIEKIQLDISDIAGRIKTTKAEMAALRHPLANEDKFQQASEELTAVVSATEGATNAIMQSAEDLDEIVQELRSQMPDGYQSSRLNDMNDQIVRIYEACNFQDLTGQRITKVVRALAFIEERVEAMMSVWNRKEFELMPLPPGIARKDGELELHGPNEADAGKGMIDQAQIDALFD
jgi:chemotaxis protein CheZ